MTEELRVCPTCSTRITAGGGWFAGARAYYRMGRLNQILGRSQVSENAYRRAVALGEQLAAAFPTRPEFRLELASSHNYLGVLLNTTRSQEAEAAYAEALTILKKLAADFRDRPEFRQVLAGVHNNLGNLLFNTNRSKEAEAAHIEALAIRKQLAADFPTLPNIHRAMAMSHNNLGWLFQSTGRLDGCDRGKGKCSPVSSALYRKRKRIGRGV